MTTKFTTEATRIAAGDDRVRYDNFSMTLHWLTVFLGRDAVFAGRVWGFTARPVRSSMIIKHMSFGILLTALLLIRIAWRLTPGHRVRDAVEGWVEFASKGVPYLLYCLLAVQAALGFVLRWSGNEAMSFFELLIPSPFAPFSKPAHELVGEAHNWIGWTIIILAGGHATAALFHHFVLRDNVLWRMLPGLRAR
jgi:cytochrome b561